jgi:hypothetical protein
LEVESDKSGFGHTLILPFLDLKPGCRDMDCQSSAYFCALVLRKSEAKGWGVFPQAKQ